MRADRTCLGPFPMKFVINFMARPLSSPAGNGVIIDRIVVFLKIVVHITPRKEAVISVNALFRLTINRYKKFYLLRCRRCYRFHPKHPRKPSVWEQLIPTLVLGNNEKNILS